MPSNLNAPLKKTNPMHPNHPVHIKPMNGNNLRKNRNKFTNKHKRISFEPTPVSRRSTRRKANRRSSRK